MLEWILILVFGGSTIVTPEPIYISDQPFLISFDKPITAYRKWATFYVDISQYSNEGLDYLK
ncbi:hypothetical protein ACJJID_15140 [Microbulbifer sp. CnH-101-G]|uniref:hypothetical protein n=1 Tax=Microbulbifer sp. CnH-101-G TaxID=3243393 RepID=UPI00403A6240